eukprot:SAG31_NODE_43068_length_268_cov_1.816568_1_plen_78_part_01
MERNHQLAVEAECERLAKIAERKRQEEEWSRLRAEEARARQEHFVRLAGGFDAALFRAVVDDDVEMLELVAHNGGDLA